jgi:hypothetical protein
MNSTHKATSQPIMGSKHEAAGLKSQTQYTRLPASHQGTNTRGCSFTLWTQCTKLPASHYGLNTPGCQSQIMDLIYEASSFTPWTRKSRMPVCYHGLNAPDCLLLVTDTMHIRGCLQYVAPWTILCYSIPPDLMVIGEEYTCLYSRALNHLEAFPYS